MILLDTTVLVHAVGSEHPLRAAAAAVIEAVGFGRLAATTTPEVIQEFTHVRARRRDRADAGALARDLVTLLTPLTPVTASDVHAGLELFERHPELGCFDAVLAAVARRVGASLVSADGAFAAVLGGGHVPLGDDTVSRLGVTP
jgi:uncharacterized protein